MHAALPVAAAAPLRDVLTSPALPARVTVVGRFAGYVVVPQLRRLVAVTTPDAVVLPCAVLLPAGLDPRDVLRPGQDVSLGGGGLLVDGQRLAVRRWWAPAVLPVGVPRVDAVARARRALASRRPTTPTPARDQALAAALPAASALAAGDATGALRRLVPVLGLGPGSTPSGDDVCAGLLLGARATGSPAPLLDEVGSALLDAAADRTTAVSAGLLAEAVAGRAVAPVVTLARTLLGQGDVDAAVARLDGLGHTSGLDIATGLVAAATARTAVPSRRRSA